MLTRSAECTFSLETRVCCVYGFMEACGCSDFFSGDVHSMVVHGDFAPAAFSGVAVTGSRVVRRFALVVCDGSAAGFDAALFWFAGSVADAVVLLLRCGAHWCRDEARP